MAFDFTEEFHDFFRGRIQKGAWIMATDKTSDHKIVGIAGNRVAGRNDPIEDDDGPEDSNADLVSTWMDFAHQRYDPWSKLKVDTMLEIEFLAVHKDYRGLGLSVKMIEFTFEFMRKEKIPLAYVLATSAYSQAVFKKMCFELVDEMKYEDYKVDGKVVFQPEKVHVGWAIFIKWI